MIPPIGEPTSAQFRFLVTVTDMGRQWAVGGTLQAHGYYYLPSLWLEEGEGAHCDYVLAYADKVR